MVYNSKKIKKERESPRKEEEEERRKGGREGEREEGRKEGNGGRKGKCPTMGNFLSDQTLNLVSTYYVPDLFLGTFQVLMHLIFTAICRIGFIINTFR